MGSFLHFVSITGFAHLLIVSYIVLARKYRPQIFDSVVGQAHITDTLKNALESDRVAHAYLFTGPRGVGKTTTARILAKTLNCEQPYPEAPCNKCRSCLEITAGNSMNVIEIDGASNRGIDHIRDLRENIKYTPSSGKYKIYIIDEVHMLTTEAFNALLKTLEEPPAHAKFFMATTEIQKVPATILSRCQRFDFRLIPPIQVVEQLESIAANEGIKTEREGLLLLARYSGGSMRDAESFFDQLIVYANNEPVSVEMVRNFLGIVSNDSLFEVIDAIYTKNTARGLEAINSIIEKGHDIAQFIDDLLQIIRAMMLCKTDSLNTIADMGDAEKRMVEEKSTQFTLEQILYMMNIILNDRQKLKVTFSQRVFLEVLFVKLTKSADLVPVGDLLAQVALKPMQAPARPTPQPLPPSIQPTAFVKPQQQPAPTPAPQAQPAPQHPEGTNPGPVLSDAATATAPAKEPAVTAQLSSPPAPATPQAQPVFANTGDFSQVWKQLLQNLSQTQPLAATFLAQGRLMGFENDIISVEFSPDERFHIEQLQNSKSSAAIKDALAQAGMGQAHVKYVIGNSMPKKKPENQTQQHNSSRPQESMTSSSHSFIPQTKEEREQPDIESNPLLGQIAEHPHVKRMIKLTEGKIVKITNKPRGSI